MSSFVLLTNLKAAVESNMYRIVFFVLQDREILIFDKIQQRGLGGKVILE